MSRRRLDRELVRRGLAATIDEARDTVLAGGVTVSGRPALKPGTLVAPAEPVGVAAPGRPYVSRGGEKLAAALTRFGIDPRGRSCLDAGASTGGFTDVLLAQGARQVTAVDVGYGQLAWSLREDPRVNVMERTNVRDLRPGDLDPAPDVVAADLSFISLRAAVPALAGVAADGAVFVLLVKPQFEAKADQVSPGGVIRDPEVWERVIEEVAEACRGEDVGPVDVMPSPLPGPAGNIEFFLHAVKGHPGRALDVAGSLAEAPSVRGRG